jgi:hypothetical protein
MNQDVIAWVLDGLVLLLALAMVRVTRTGLRTGIARGRYGRTASRADNPSGFRQLIWMTGISAGVLAIFAVALAVRLIVRGAA